MCTFIVSLPFKNKSGAKTFISNDNCRFIIRTSVVADDTISLYIMITVKKREIKQKVYAAN